MAGLFVVCAWVGCGSGGEGMMGFVKKEVELVVLSLNRVTPSLIRIGLVCQPQLASKSLFVFLPTMLIHHQEHARNRPTYGLFKALEWRQSCSEGYKSQIFPLLQIK